ncbi:hypothetical protein JCM10908_001460 [Rhodotorula pacifica]|uniref:uncharacterized protein n=1 Tax=Rhodotorula pacifica TaxID=1495444 RepID=UPI00317DB2BF
MGIVKFLEVPAHAGAVRKLDNIDLRATPIERRTWGFWFFCSFWFAAWIGGSSWLALGLSFWDGVGCSTAGYFIISLWMVACGRPGARYNIGFPVVCRSSFGIWGAGWPALNRAVMAIVWQGVNSVSGGQALYVMLYSMFPSIGNIDNKMPKGSALTSAQMICFFVFLVLNGLMLMLDIPKWKRLVWTKVLVFCISAAGMLALAVTKAGGKVGPVVSRGATVHGSERSWLLIRMILTSAASCSTFASNASDWQRNATRPNDPILGQLIGFPLSNFIVQIIGMLVASTSEVVYGEVVWNPVVYLERLLVDNFDAAHRAGAFFISAGFVYSLLFSVSVFENVYCCGNDLASLCPRFISVKRGFYICLCASAVINPWYLLGSASIFITVLASYQIFLFSIAAIIIVDYWAVCKGRLVYEDLYTTSKLGTYFYSFGFNWRAFVAYFIGVAINFAGFLTNFGIIKSIPLTHSYYFAIFTTTFAAGIVYYLLATLFPQRNLVDKWSEPQGVWDPVDDQTDFVGSVSSDAALDEEKDSKLGGEGATTDVLPAVELRG